LLVAFFLPNSHSALGPDLLVIHTYIWPNFPFLCRTLCQFYSAHSTLAPLSTGMGKTWPLHPALCGASACWTLAILATGIRISPSHLWPFAPWLHRLQTPGLLVLQVFFRGHPRENFLAWAMSNTQSKISSDSPLGCLLYNLTKLGLKGSLKWENLIFFLQKFNLNTNYIIPLNGPNWKF
jgi:hypothetical protein